MASCLYNSVSLWEILWSSHKKSQEEKIKYQIASLQIL